MPNLLCGERAGESERFNDNANNFARCRFRSKLLLLLQKKSIRFQLIAERAEEAISRYDSRLPWICNLHRRRRRRPADAGQGHCQESCQVCTCFMHSSSVGGTPHRTRANCIPSPRSPANTGQQIVSQSVPSTKRWIIDRVSHFLLEVLSNKSNPLAGWP